MKRPIAQTHLQLFAQLQRRGRPATELRAALDACAAATRATDGLYRGSGKPFVCHLIGVASIVDHGGARFDVVLAALLHALPQARVVGDRDWRGVVLGFGHEVLQLVADYDSHTPTDAGLGRPQGSELDLLLLADELEDLIDLAPCYHARGSAATKGSAEWRMHRARIELTSRRARAIALGQPWMAREFSRWTRCLDDRDLPDVMRGGAHTSGRLDLHASTRP